VLRASRATLERINTFAEQLLVWIVEKESTKAVAEKIRATFASLDFHRVWPPPQFVWSACKAAHKVPKVKQLARSANLERFPTCRKQFRVQSVLLASTKNLEIKPTV
jgi:hypothetical protein